MDMINYMAVYLDDSCEVHFSNENSKLILSPCGSEFMYLTYKDSMTSSSFKYRTAYATSKFSKQLAIILKQRNRFCERPFLSPTLLEMTNNFWLSTENLTEFKWTKNDYLNKNQIEIDYHNFFYLWKSTCKKAQIKLHFNKQIIIFKTPIKIPINEMDEFDVKYDITNTSKNYLGKIKNIFKYTYNEQEYSTKHLPFKFINIYENMIKLVENLNNSDDNNLINLLENDNNREYFVLKFEDALPLTCESTHLHRFDSVQTASEPKIIYVNQTWYKLFYDENKSIELSCPSPTTNSFELMLQQQETSSTELLDKTNQLNETFSCIDYLISDSPTGRYYTCYSLNERNGQIDELKLCIDNIPSFKQNLKKLLNYSNILLKRLNSINYITNYLTCSSLINKKSKFNNNNDENEIKMQSVITNVGHFKYFYNNSIFIQFIDKVKLYVDNESINNFHVSNVNNSNDKCFCTIILPDMSQHEINFTCMLTQSAAAVANSSILNMNFNYFSKYIDFLNQWLKWLFPEKFEIINDVKKLNDFDDRIDGNSIKYHVNRLKLFNFTIEQELNYNNEIIKEVVNDDVKAEGYDFDSIHDLLKQNSEFLKNISK